jgi:hypothetical protein
VTDAIFGLTAGAEDLAAGIKGMLQEWMPTYLAYESRKIAAQGSTIGDLPDIGAYVVSNDPYHFPEEAPPALLIAIPGTMDEPLKDGSRNYRAFYDVRLVVFIDSDSRDNTDALARYYSEAIRMAVVQKPAMDGAAEGVLWLGESFGTRTHDVTQRTLGSAENRFRVDVRNVVTAFAGPLSPIVTTPDDWPTAVSAKVTPEPLAP